MRNSLMQTAATALLVMASSATAGTWVAAVPVQGSTFMVVFGNNDNNIVAGQYTDSSGAVHGFVGPFDGSNYTSFDDSGTGTQPRALNDKGLIVGYDTGTSVPWERFADGTLTTVTMDGNPLDKIAQGINRGGIFTGNYTDSTSGMSAGYLGKKAKFTSQISLSLPNSGFAGRAINNAGDVGGWYYDSNFVQHGFVIVAGTATSLDYPGATYTVVEGMNDKGYATGQYQDSSGFIHGFLYQIGTGAFTSLDVPGATITQVWGISNHNVIAASSDIGSYVYCLKARTCPVTGAGAAKTQHVSGKFSPAPP
jgi:hypothetical protein